MKKRLCKKCNKQIPFRLEKPDGSIKIRSGTRVHCYDCLPHGSKKLKKIGVETKCICKRCNKDYIYIRKNGSSLSQCRSCTTTIARINRKQKALKYLGYSCKNCGYNKCSRALQFHHIDRNNKICNVSAILDKSWQRIQNELDKCILLCANCHAELEDKLNVTTSPLKM